MLIRHLPEDSLTQTILRDQPRLEPATTEGPRKFGPWALGDYLAANLIDAVNRNTYAVAVAGHFRDPKPPEPFPRPGLQRGPARVQSDAAVLYLDKLRARG